MKLVFAGTPEFAAVALRALYDAGHDIPLVLTQPDRPAGRGLKRQASAVKQLAQARKSQILQPRGLRLDGKYTQDALSAQNVLAGIAPEVIVVAAYGLILPQWLLDLPARGCINVHASLLPRWRGAAPIHRAIEAGDTVTGVTIMQMDAGLDTGPVLCERALPITGSDTMGTLHDKVASLGAQLIIEQLQDRTPWNARPQPAEGITYAEKVEKSESRIDWMQSATTIARRIRAFNPFPGTQTFLHLPNQPESQMLKLWLAHQVTDPISSSLPPTHKPGHVIGASEHGIYVQCGQDVLQITQLQRAGGKKLCAGEFLRGNPMPAGCTLA